jgi:hypothetical protein
LTAFAFSLLILDQVPTFPAVALLRILPP